MIGILLLAAGLCGQIPDPQPRAPDPDELPPGAIARLGTARLTHPHLGTIAVSSNGKLVASASRHRSSVVEFRPAGVRIEDGVEVPENEAVYPTTVRLWDTAGKLQFEWKTPDGPVTSLAFAADGAVLFAACGVDLVAWDTATGKLRWSRDRVTDMNLAHESELHLVADGRLLLIHAGNALYQPNEKTFARHWQRRLQLFDPKNGERGALPKSFESTTAKDARERRVIHAAAATPAGDAVTLVVSRATPREDAKPGQRSLFDFADRRLETVDLANGKVDSRPEPDPIETLCYNPDGTTLALISKDTVWIAKRGAREKSRLPGSVKGGMMSARFTRDDELAVSTIAGGLYAWNMWNTRTLQRIEDHDVNDLKMKAVRTPHLTATICGDSIVLLDPRSGKPLPASPGHRFPPFVRFGRDAEEILAHDGVFAFRWNAKTRAPTWRSLTETSIEENAWATPQFSGWLPTAWGDSDVELSPANGMSIESTAGGVQIVRAPAGKVVHTLTIESKHPAEFCLAGNRALVTAKDAYCFFDVASGKRLASIPYTDPGRMINFFDSMRSNVIQPLISVRGTWFASIIDNSRVHLWSVDTGKLVHSLTPDAHAKDITVVRLRFTPDERHLLGECYDPGERNVRGRLFVVIWDVASGEVVRKFDIGDVRFVPRRPHIAYSIQAWDLSPDLRQLAISRHAHDPFEPAPHSIDIWEVASGAKRSSLVGHGELTSVGFSPDGRRLVSGGYDTSILIWDIDRPPPDAKLKDRLGPDELTALWAALAADDAEVANQAAWALTRAAKDSVPFLKTALRRTDAPDVDKLRKRIDDLDKGFAVRDAAFEELLKNGWAIEGDLASAAKKDRPLEQARRIEQLLAAARAANQLYGNDRLGDWRATEVLRRIGNDDALGCLRDLAGGAPRAPLTKIAASALR